jgi:hypothetical protein
MVLIPLILNLIAASLHKYPFGDRLLEYGVLNLYLPIAFFLAWMVKGNSKIRWVRIVAMILIVGNLAEPTINAADKLIFPRKYEQMKQVVLYVRAHMVESDTIFVHYPAYTTFSYYRERFQLNSGNIHRLGWRPTPSDFRSLSGRGWLVFGHAKEYRGTDYEALFVSEARTEGKMIDKYIDIGASAYLFSFHDARGGNKTYPLIPRKVAAK